jgi:hypothetical protein
MCSGNGGVSGTSLSGLAIVLPAALSIDAAADVEAVNAFALAGTSTITGSADVEPDGAAYVSAVVTITDACARCGAR